MKESERKQVRQDEADATVRDGARQAALEKEGTYIHDSLLSDER